MWELIGILVLAGLGAREVVIHLLNHLAARHQRQPDAAKKVALLAGSSGWYEKCLQLRVAKSEAKPEPEPEG